MRMSATFCREQEALQRAKALSEPLENRRGIAMAAAKAWEAEAISAEKRDAKLTPLDKLDTAIVLQFALEADEVGEGQHIGPGHV
ncbi:hypothetical protein QUC32_14195 [Novosphingobium resinovorum]|uniref:Uncharacterized protein n=1 Tax=Novosphingobium resinovorum TaxID=158500 RepID=A0A031K770_9SPHN|nr:MULTISPECIES: hypothetical protein [Sphingomonadaceae]AOR75509.1 hypothetical protein BES08_01090 [Novosphingobium resinovorum]EJU13557.1 hypothetical protein LH128_08054 [Sphingomonas sp. LH128]EZP84452.1 hypothetical protein BV97_00203 [Novosphingobium resinovorum]MBF7010824.1 hypothetical protein [Novosphingobium sp. HR1a]WJM28822.1 hypothetical protein QUC32_14195 [Novosphingobium resinovorum]